MIVLLLSDLIQKWGYGMPDTIINWLVGLVKTIPEDIIKALIMSFFTLVLGKLVRSVNFINSNINNFMVKIFNTDIEISPKTSFIDSPEYNYVTNSKREFVHKHTSSDNDVWEIIFVFALVASIIVYFVKENAEPISLFLKWFGLIPLIVSIIFLFIISFSKEVQKITVKFIIFSIVVSTLTLYYGFKIKEMATTMSPSIVDTRNFSISVYKILGVLIAIFQQLISYILLLRVLSVYIDRKLKNPIQAIRKIIFKTKQFESVLFLVIFVIIFSVSSYLLTLNDVYNFLLR